MLLLRFLECYLFFRHCLFILNMKDVLSLFPTCHILLARLDLSVSVFVLHPYKNGEVWFVSRSVLDFRRVLKTALSTMKGLCQQHTTCNLASETQWFGIVFIGTVGIIIPPFTVSQVRWKAKWGNVCAQALSSLEESYFNQAYN